MMDAALRQVRENHQGATRQLRLGVSRSLSLAHLPGLLHHWLQQNNSATLEVTHQHSGELLESLIQQRLDAAILGAPGMLPAGCRIVRRMADAFVLVAPEAMTVPPGLEKPRPRWTKAIRNQLENQTWLILKA